MTARCYTQHWLAVRSWCWMPTALLVLIVLAVVLASCTRTEAPNSGPTSMPSSAPSSAAPEPEPKPTTTPRIEAVSSRQWERMKQAGVWRPGCPLTRRDLRRVEVRHWRFDGATAVGVLVVNRDVARTVAEIFAKLFSARFPIRRMQPVEAYGGDVNASLRADNTSAYNCRRPDQINAPTRLSPHANGRAIDINPRENPWRDLRCRCWVPTATTRERVAGPGVIVRGGLVWRLFTRRGWIWQNIDVPDYMHFDTGYPSKPYGQRQ